MRLFSLTMAVYFFLGSLLPGMDYSQLLRIQNLRDHYQFHVSLAELEGEEMSFREFLYCHYWQPDGHQHEENHAGDHQDLPLHSSGTHLALVTSWLLVSEHPPLCLDTPPLDYYRNPIAQDHRALVFRPPLA